jgi:hypothetical protein
MKYILYVAQDCNFQSRTMLIPMEEFLKVRRNDYDVLKKYSVKKTFDNYTVDNVLYIEYKQESKNSFSQVITPYTKILNQLTSYADGMDHFDDETGKFENVYFDMKDKIWYDLAVTNLCGGFNHVENYKQLLNDKVVDSFLVLENDINK